MDSPKQVTIHNGGISRGLGSKLLLKVRPLLGISFMDEATFYNFNEMGDVKQKKLISNSVLSHQILAWLQIYPVRGGHQSLESGKSDKMAIRQFMTR